MFAFILSNENGKFKMEVISQARVEGLATHYLRTPGL